MTEKRFQISNWTKHWQKIVDNGKILSQNNVCELLNELNDENEQLKKRIGNLEHTRDFCADVCADCERLEKENEQLKETIDDLTSEFEGYHKSLEETKDYDKQFEVTSCPYEIRNNKSLDYYWLEHQGNVIGICNVLNDQSDQINELEKENEQLKKENEDLSDEVYILQDDILNKRVRNLIEENEQLKQNCTNYAWYKQYKILLNENEELQSDLEELHEICKQYETKLHETIKGVETEQ